MVCRRRRAGVRMRRGRDRRCCSVVRGMGAVDVWGVRPVEVRDAAARPVEWIPRGCFGCEVEDGLGVLDGALFGAGEAAEEELLLFERAFAPLPRAALLRFAFGSFLSFCCSGVRVFVPSFRYLNELRFLDSTF